VRQFDDPELAELFREDPDLLDLARAAQVRELDVPVGSNFQAYLRARLLDEAQHRLRPRGLARLRAALGSRGGVAAAFGGAAGAVMIAAAVIAFTQGHTGNDTVTVSAVSQLSGQTNVDPHTNAITIAFNEPMNQASVVKALHIVPATSFSTSWSGNTLTITPTHGLSASTAYVVRIDNSVARSSAGQAPAAPIVVPFGTQPTSPPVVGPAPSATPTLPPVLAMTVLGQTGPHADVVPAPGGGVLVTDVSSPSASPSPSPAASANASSSTSTGTSSPTPSPSSSSSPSGSSTSGQASGSTGSASPAGSASSSSTSTASPPSGLVSYGSGTPSVVGSAATAASVSPRWSPISRVAPTSLSRASTGPVRAT
jgi:Big-like domain-containing protein